MMEQIGAPELPDYARMPLEPLYSPDGTWVIPATSAVRASDYAEAVKWAWLTFQVHGGHIAGPDCPAGDDSPLYCALHVLAMRVLSRLCVPPPSPGRKFRPMLPGELADDLDLRPISSSRRLT